MFDLVKEESTGKARAGIITTSRNIIETPVFMPVGTQGTVKAIIQEDLAALGYQIILGNTYHLYLRPYTDVLENSGGIHNFINWDRSILTDSGGYQVYSLKELRKITEDGVEFKSYIDGSKHFFSPEKVMDFQNSIGADIVMVFDECTPYPADKSEAKKSMDLSFKWARRSYDAFQTYKPKYDKRQFLFAIGQGGMYNDLRKAYLEKIIDIDYNGYAIGGLSVGEPCEIMYDLTEISTDILPKDKPRYLMGVGTPQNILESIDRGIDMFDCVMPTRNARNGQIFTTRGKVNIKNSKYKYSNEPIDIGLENKVSSKYSMSYLRHLFMSNEILGLMLATYQNLAFYKWLTATAREKIISGTYRQWKQEIIDIYNNSEK